jgi:hypothetical protein
MGVTMGYSGSSAAPVRYLFIDGGYLRARYSEMMTEFFGEATVRDIDFGRVKMDAFKAFYYDCLDDTKKAGEDDKDVEKRVAFGTREK